MPVLHPRPADAHGPTPSRACIVLVFMASLTCAAERSLQGWMRSTI